MAKKIKCTIQDLTPWFFCADYISSVVGDCAKTGSGLVQKRGQVLHCASARSIFE